MRETAMVQSIETNELLYEVQKGLGWITLNRPKALNALSTGMIRSLAALLGAWEVDPSIKAVIIQGAGEKAFCAGGDVRAVYDAKREGNLQLCDAFFREEYTLNAHIYLYKKPYVALIDGIAMGGGLGVSINGSYRIVTERALLAMPETGIGFFPDVGGTTFLSNTPGVIGLYLGLTGTRLKAEDALWAGLATHFMPSSALSPFMEALKSGRPLEDALEAYCQEPQEIGFLEHHYGLIETHFNQSSLMAILESLAKDPSPFAQNTYNTLRSKSPTSLAVVFRQLTQNGINFMERMKREFRLSQHFVEGHDFIEGIRAVLVDKDQLPRWKPAQVEDLTPQEIDHYFSSLGEKEWVF